MAAIAPPSHFRPTMGWCLMHIIAHARKWRNDAINEWDISGYIMGRRMLLATPSDEVSQWRNASGRGQHQTIQTLYPPEIRNCETEPERHFQSIQRRQAQYIYMHVLSYIAVRIFYKGAHLLNKLFENSTILSEFIPLYVHGQDLNQQSGGVCGTSDKGWLCIQCGFLSSVWWVHSH